MVSVILSRCGGLLFGSLTLDVQSGYLRAERAQMALLWEVARGGSASVLQRLPRPRTSVRGARRAVRACRDEVCS